MDPQAALPARTLLRAAGTLMIVFGALGIVLYLLATAGIVALLAATDSVFSARDDIIGIGLLLVGALAELIAGILSLRAAKQPARVRPALYVWDVLTLLLSLAGMAHIALRIGTAPWWELALGLVLCTVVPVAALCAARRMKQTNQSDT